MSDNKSKLEERIIAGLYGQPELKKREKNRYLGEYKERVIKYLTYQQVVEVGTYPEILSAIRHSAAKKLIIDRKVNLRSAHDYIKLARDNNLQFKRISSPELVGDIALVVVSDQAVEVKNRGVLSREEQLKQKGISDYIIRNVGARLCAQCWSELARKAPEELINYQKSGWLDQITGHKCVCEEGD